MIDHVLSTCAVHQEVWASYSPFHAVVYLLFLLSSARHLLRMVSAECGEGILCAGEWDSYWHMLEELQDRADKGSKADKGTKAALKPAAKSAAKKAASGRKDGRRYDAFPPFTALACHMHCPS